MSIETDSYISDKELEYIRKQYGRKIILFADTLHELNKWHKAFGTICPLSCVNNYRDSWFHYRKMWKERSSHEEIRQMANLDEHLQRAEKDALVGFFQDVSREIEYWYLFEDASIPKELEGNIIQNIDSLMSCNLAAPDEKTMASIIWEKYKMEDPASQLKEQEASFALIYWADKFVLNRPEVRTSLQKLLHKMKNATLEIRLAASNIDRIDEPGEYVRQYRCIYEELKAFFEKEENSEIFFLMGLTDVVAVNIAEYKMEQ